MSLAWLVYSSVGAKFDSLLKQKSLAYIFCGIRFFFFQFVQILCVSPSNKQKEKYQVILKSTNFNGFAAFFFSFSFCIFTSFLLFLSEVILFSG